MPVRWVERFQIYVLNVGNLAAGAFVEDLPLPFDSDAPFVLRGRGGRCQNDPRYFQAGMNGLSVRYRDPNDRYNADAPVPWYLDVPGNGLGGAWKRVYPQKYYPLQSTLLTSIYNTGPSAVDLTNVQLYYVGVKHFPPDYPVYTFPAKPAKFSVLPFRYTYWSKSPSGVNLPFQTALMTPSANLQRIPVQVQTDADFALLGGTCGIYGRYTDPYFYMELFCTLRDRWEKPYMNLPVHVDWLFAPQHQSVVATEGDFYLANNSQSIFESYNAADTPWSGEFGPAGLAAGWTPGQTPLAGAWHPATFYPQIYVPANSSILFDLQRNDAGFTTAYSGAAPGEGSTIVPPDINFHISFQGLKVFKR